LYQLTTAVEVTKCDFTTIASWPLHSSYAEFVNSSTKCSLYNYYVFVCSTCRL